MNSVHTLGKKDQVDIPTGATTQVRLGGEILPWVQGIDWARDAEGYIAGDLVYLLVLGQPGLRLQPGKTYKDLEIVVTVADVEHTILHVPGIIIASEKTGIGVDDIVMEIECRWYYADPTMA